MACPSAPAGFDLHGAAVATSAGLWRAPLRILDGLVAAAAIPRAARIDLRGHLVFPALANAHDHLHVNAVPPLPQPAKFSNSYEWMEAFKAHFAAPGVATVLALPMATRLRHGALRNLLAGTTCVAHHDPWHPACAEPGFPVTVLREYGWSYALGWTEYGPDPRTSFERTARDRPWIIHLAEGTDAQAAAELERLVAIGCLAANSVLVHGVGLRARDVERIIECGAAVVWCPSSNHSLLGVTLDPRRLCEAGRLALGTDSRLTGARDLLDEMRGVLMRGELDARRLLELATVANRRLLRLPGSGRLSPGDPADLVVVRDDGRTGLAGLRRHALRAVVRNGLPCIADPDFADWFALAGVPARAVTLDGVPKLLAEALADPALMALEPGLEPTAHRAGARAAAACLAEAP